MQSDTPDTPDIPHTNDARPDDTYTHGHADSVLRSHRRRTVENSAAYLVPHLRAGQAVLDVGCGPGTITIDLGRRVPDGTVLGIDRSDDVLAEASRNATDAGITNVRFASGDVYALDHPDDSFDVVHAHQVLQHLSDPVAALREMQRVCRPDGVVAVRDADYAAMTWFPAEPLMDRWLQLTREAARANDGDPDAGRALLSWAHAAGFSSVEPSASAWCFATSDDREWWGGLWADRVTITSLAEQLVASGAATTDELTEIAGALRRWATKPDGWFAVLHGELICRP